MKKTISIILLAIFILSFAQVNASTKLIIINTNKYEPQIEPIIQKNITKTIIITKIRKIKTHNLDQTYYNFQRNKIYDDKDRLDNLNYKDKISIKTQAKTIPRSHYSKYYECYNSDFNHYSKDYNYHNPCQN